MDVEKLGSFVKDLKEQKKIVVEERKSRRFSHWSHTEAGKTLVRLCKDLYLEFSMRKKEHQDAVQNFSFIVDQIHYDICHLVAERLVIFRISYPFQGQVPTEYDCLTLNEAAAFILERRRTLNQRIHDADAAFVAVLQPLLPEMILA
jgi:hypothetical protein